MGVVFLGGLGVLAALTQEMAPLPPSGEKADSVPATAVPTETGHGDNKPTAATTTATTPVVQETLAGTSAETAP